MANFSFRIYFEGYESPKKELEIEDHELEGMSEEEREEYGKEFIDRLIDLLSESRERNNNELCTKK